MKNLKKIIFYLVAISMFTTNAFSMEVKPQEFKPREVKSKKVIKIVDIGVAHDQGRRPTMEDADSVDLKFEGRPNNALLGVYDGHGGDKVSNIVAQKLPSLIQESLKISKTPDQALIKAFEKIDSDLKYSRFHEEALRQGTTAIVVYKNGNTIYAANAGDSRAILSRNGVQIALSTDHKPDRPDEKARIESLGGKVIFFGVPRVQGTLAISRAIGDHALSPFVIPTPEIEKINLTNQDDFLILACDGIFEVMDNQGAVDTVRAFLKTHKNQPRTAQKAAEYLVQKAYDKGSRDNLSVIVALLKESSEPIHLEQHKKELILSNQTIRDLQQEIKSHIHILANITPDKKFYTTKLNEDIWKIITDLTKVISQLDKPRIKRSELEPAIRLLMNIKEWIRKNKKNQILFQTDPDLYGKINLTQFANILDATIDNFKKAKTES